MTKRPDYENGVVTQPNDRTDFLKKLVSLDGVIRALDQVNTRASNKANVKASDRADTRGSNGVGMTIGPHFEDEIGRVKTEVNTGDFYKLDLFIFEVNHAKNFFSYNFANVLANLFGNLLSTSINFHSSPAFPVSSSHPATSDSISDYKFLDFISSDGLATCNPNNILTFYY